ncbi:hypothetical protein PBRA_009122 [Plasmodiophora brassicae]|uniref:Uncharacterized protein n=1 Tax=Plasmodiophora brassicae TaxID=37360 RepID=A0A0G4J4H2_PLABS|nr:hypothetical protein PBRA_009122 [Plasmodiophora brassicae]
MALDTQRQPFLDKEDNRFTTTDINLPRPRYYFRKADHRFDVSDIEGARSTFRDAKLNPSRRCVNPLDPIYKLASFTHVPPEPVRFVRDTLDISDIPGTKTTVPYVMRMRTRDHINYDDVPGSVAAYHINRHLARRTRNILRVDDINDNGSFRTRRHTDPLSPRYDYDSACSSGLLSFAADGKPVAAREDRPALENDLGYIPGSHPKRLGARAVPTFALTTRDIAGNETMFQAHRKDRLLRYGTARHTNDTRDIVGAQADTAGKWKWIRRTNPLMPDYQPLDRGDAELNACSLNNIGMLSELGETKEGAVQHSTEKMYADVERERLRSRGSDGASSTGSSDADRRETKRCPWPCCIRWAAAHTDDTCADERVPATRSSASSVTSRSTGGRSSKKSSKTRSTKEVRERRENEALVRALPIVT